jgi:hypothetical protein
MAEHAIVVAPTTGCRWSNCPTSCASTATGRTPPTPAGSSCGRSQSDSPTPRCGATCRRSRIRSGCCASCAAMSPEGGGPPRRAGSRAERRRRCQGTWRAVEGRTGRDRAVRRAAVGRVEDAGGRGGGPAMGGPAESLRHGFSGSPRVFFTPGPVVVVGSADRWRRRAPAGSARLSEFPARLEAPRTAQCAAAGPACKARAARRPTPAPDGAGLPRPSPAARVPAGLERPPWRLPWSTKPTEKEQP